MPESVAASTYFPGYSPGESTEILSIVVLCRRCRAAAAARHRRTKLPIAATRTIPRFGLTKPYLVSYCVEQEAGDDAKADVYVLSVLDRSLRVADGWMELGSYDSLDAARNAADAHRGKPVSERDWVANPHSHV